MSDADKSDMPKRPASPCIGVCQMDAEGRYCLGCRRTLDEIAGWLRYSDDERRAVLVRLEQRREPAG